MLKRLSRADEPATGGLIRLTYMSKATSLAAHPDPWTATSRLRAQSERLNRLYGLTGALLAGRDWFIQTLEGEPVAIYATFARINLDLRHQDIRLFEVAPVHGRLFEDWAMHVGSMDAVSPASLWMCVRTYRRMPPGGAPVLLRALEESVYAA